MSFGQCGRVALAGATFDAVTEAQAVAGVREALARGTGGWIVTPNVDILRLADRDPGVRRFLADATLVVADGMPLIWASRLAGTPLPQRVAGSSLIWTLSAALAQEGRTVYVLGGSPEQEGAARAAAVLARRYPGLRVAGYASPPFGFDTRPAEYAAVCADIVDVKPDLVFVGLGFPKQERLISHLRAELPAAWFLGCGAAVTFVAGDARRAPQWMQKSGLEWLHRMASDPSRLTGRYLRHDAPYALRLLAGSAARRFNGSWD